MLFCAEFKPAAAELVEQHLTAPAREALADFAQRAQDTDWTREAISALIKAVLADRGLKMPQLAIPLRVAVTGQMQRQGTDAGVTEQFTAGVGVAEFELDLFGRVRNLSEAALQQYFAVAANRRNAQLSLVAETATAWLTYGADAQRLKIADATLKTYEDSLRLAEARHERGGSSALELTQTRTLVETARTDAARLRGQLAQDRNALALLAGGQLDASLLPDSIEPQLLALAPPPAGLPSDVLLQRPDIMAAEHQLLAANANIGAARAAFFPSISLTGSIGSGSSELSNLFDSGTRVWSFLPKITLPIFQGGKLRANLANTDAQYDLAVANYNQAVLDALRDVADQVNAVRSLAQQAHAQQQAVDTARAAFDLAQQRYRAGIGSYLPGQTVVKGTDGKLYACRPFPEGAWCNINAEAYRPGTGSAWRDAWIEY
ncbi:hypothetical protein G6F59_012828 [Rhizopus arrhizus]|nr:hypothetical protein G6F59_012828 [Rhizopus arrhizus]